MKNSKHKTSPGAVISFEGQPEKLRACLHSLSSWVSPIVVIHSERDKNVKQIAEEFNASTIICPWSGTHVKWSEGLKQISKQWILLLRSNEVVTGQLRKTIIEKTNTNEVTSCQYPLPLTLVFLKKRMKYSLDSNGSKLSRLIYLSKGTETIDRLPNKYVRFEGELIRYGEETIYDCSDTVVKKTEEKACHLGQYIKSTYWGSYLIYGIFSSIKIFFKVYFLRKGFREGFEGAVFSICEAHAEILGYLRHYELYVRGGKNLRDSLPSLKKVLLIKLRDIGDNILCTPLIHNLKQYLPNASISVLTWSYSQPVFENNSSIDKIFGLSKEPSATDIKKLCKQLNSSNFDLVINTHSGSLSSSLLSKVKAKHRINNYYRGRNKSYTLITQESNHYRSSIERDLDCLRSLGLEPKSTKTEIFLKNDELLWAKNELKAKGLDPEKKLVLIHPSAAAPIREWPLEKFSQLIQSLKIKENIQPIVICTNFEYSRVKSLLNDIPDLVIFYQITVRQMMAIIHECDLVIDNDSSPSHVATALGIPTIVLFSQAIREIFRPYHPTKDSHFVFYNDVDCRECELTYCDDRVCLDFSPNEVHIQALKMLSCEGS